MLSTDGSTSSRGAPVSKSTSRVSASPARTSVPATTQPGRPVIQVGESFTGGTLPANQAITDAFAVQASPRSWRPERGSRMRLD